MLLQHVDFNFLILITSIISSLSEWNCGLIDGSLSFRPSANKCVGLDFLGGWELEMFLDMHIDEVILLLLLFISCSSVSILPPWMWCFGILFQCNHRGPLLSQSGWGSCLWKRYYNMHLVPQIMEFDSTVTRRVTSSSMMAVVWVTVCWLWH